MARKVIWNRRAIHQLDEIIKYLEINASETAIRNLLIEIDQLIEKLNNYPEIGRKSKKFKTIRQYKLDIHRRIYYRKHGAKLLIVYIFDDRQNPKSNLYK